jgi:valyl-tRNA synthetase
VQLYNERLIYKDKRLVNWDPKLLTAISDLEVVQVETKGHLWHLRYPIEGKTFNAEDASTFIVVATTRPETMLGDSAVAVHPEDERYKNLVGKNVILPLVGRKIPIIADEYSDPEKGSGAVKITPAHDFNDFEVGKRHKLPQISILDQEARIQTEILFAEYNHEQFYKQTHPDRIKTTFAFRPLQDLEALNGKDRFVVRKTIVAMMEERGLLDKIEPHSHTVPHGDRSNVVIEPFLTDQWYVDAKKMAEPAIAAVRTEKTKFVPKNWEKTFFEWMENIQPWCISRQLWWGHQIPAWYGPDKQIFVAESEEAAIQIASDHYKRTVRITKREDADYVERVVDILDQRRAIKTDRDREITIYRDEDVLDTWFSSALWPFSTLGWPDKTPELKRYYPTSALVTGFDIIFFWVARMMMMGLHFQKEVPFRDVYIHRLVRDATGAKMSKSKGNVVDPLGVIDDFGADALRFTLARGAAQGHDIRLGPQDVENNRNFATKLWNAARFVEFNGAARVEGFYPKSAKEKLNRWIAHETAKAAAEITQAIEAYAFNEAAGAAYRFVWNVYCDWYVELTKPILFVGNWIDNAIQDLANAPEYRNHTPQRVIEVILNPNFLMSEAKRLQADGVQGAHLLADAANSIQTTASDKQAYLRRIVETRAMAAWALDEILKILHPFMPFITEELWAVTAEQGPKRTNLLALSEWPKLEGLADDKAEAEIGWVIDLVTAIRSVRAELNVPASAKLWLGVTVTHTEQPTTLLNWSEVVDRWEGAIKTLARISEIALISQPGHMPGQVNLVVRGRLAVLDVRGAIDFAAERARLAKEMQKADADITRVDGKLGNANFVARAPEEVVEEEKEKRAEAVGRKAKIAEALERLKGAV